MSILSWLGKWDYCLFRATFNFLSFFYFLLGLSEDELCEEDILSYIFSWQEMQKVMRIMKRRRRSY